MITTHAPAADPDRLPRDPAPAIVSVGVFDGVHLGHRAILRANVARAEADGAVPTVVTFGRHPKALLLGHAPRTLTTLEHRLELFRRAGIAHTVVLPFDEAVRSLDAETFTRSFLAGGLAARALVLGFDSKFGHDREGTPEALRALGFDVQVVDEVLVDGRAVSSTAIREAVELGDLVGAARMLGRRPSVFGEVVEGRHLGRELGFPTANLDLHHELHPPAGVYAPLVRRLEVPLPDGDDPGAPSVTNIGQRPTVSASALPEGGSSGVEAKSMPALTIETHSFDFDGDLYGEHLEVLFVERIRDERRFEGLDHLKRQIALDVVEAHRILAGAARPG